MPPEGDDRAQRSSSTQQEAVAPEYPHDQHGLRPRGRGGTGCTQTSPTTADRRNAGGVDAAAIDVHSHAMPLPLLEWLERDGLADLSRIGDDVVLLDPTVSGVTKNAPLPLARSQYDPAHPAGGDGRPRGSSPCGVHAAVPVLLELRRRRARHHNDRARQRRAGRLRRRGRRTVVRSRVDPRSDSPTPRTRLVAVSRNWASRELRSVLAEVAKSSMTL